MGKHSNDVGTDVSLHKMDHYTYQSELICFDMNSSEMPGVIDNNQSFWVWGGKM